MKRSKVIYDAKNEAAGVIYLYQRGNLVGCGLYLKPKFQQRPVNIESATADAKLMALQVLDNRYSKTKPFCTSGTVIDLNKEDYSFEELWKMSRVVVEGNDHYIMF